MAVAVVAPVGVDVLADRDDRALERRPRVRALRHVERPHQALDLLCERALLLLERLHAVAPLGRGRRAGGRGRQLAHPALELIVAFLHLLQAFRQPLELLEHGRISLCRAERGEREQGEADGARNRRNRQSRGGTERDHEAS